MIKYVCKFCGQHLGELEYTEETEKGLGLLSLTPTERRDIITYMPNGDIVANIICEYCQETLEKNPELTLISNPLQ